MMVDVADILQCVQVGVLVLRVQKCDEASKLPRLAAFHASGNLGLGTGELLTHVVIGIACG